MELQTQKHELTLVYTVTSDILSLCTTVSVLYTKITMFAYIGYYNDLNTTGDRLRPQYI